MFYVLKIILSAGVLVAVSELGKRSTLAAALLASLPLTTVLAMVWLHFETGDTQRIAALSTSVFWLVLPSLLLLLLLPLLLRQGVAFWAALALSSIATAAGYAALLLLLRRFGIEL